MEAVACENFERSDPRGAEIFAVVIGRAKNVVLSEPCEIAQVAYFGQITNVGSGRARKLQKDRSRDGWDFSVHDCACEKGRRLRIEQNCTGPVFRPINDYWEWSRAKIIK